MSTLTFCPGSMSKASTNQTIQAINPSTGELNNIQASSTVGEVLGVTAAGVFGLTTISTPVGLSVVSNSAQTGALTAGKINYMTFSGNSTYTAPTSAALATANWFIVISPYGSCTITAGTNQQFMTTGTVGTNVPTTSTISTGDFAILAPGGSVWFVQLPIISPQTEGYIGVISGTCSVSAS